MTAKNPSGEERRRTPRRPVLDSFSLFVTIPRKGGYRLPVHDVSELGLGFDYDIDGEDPSTFPLKQGESLEVHFYLNQSLYVPLKVKVSRIFNATAESTTRRVGAELEKSSPGYKAFQSFLKMLAELESSAKVSP